jgi:hypothetical protein
MIGRAETRINPDILEIGEAWLIWHSCESGRESHQIYRDGSVAISVTKWSEADMHHFTVADTGIGMTPEQPEKMLDPFSQANARPSPFRLWI